MDQQSWKRDLDGKANEEGGDEEETKDGKKRRAKAKAKAKGRPKAKAKAKAKSKSKGKGPQESKSDPEIEAPKQQRSKKAKATQEVEGNGKKKGKKTEDTRDAQIAQPTKRKAQDVAGDSGEKDSGAKAKDSDSGKGRKTFARRYRPSTASGGLIWDSLRSAFVSVVAVQLEMRAPSKVEASNA